MDKSLMREERDALRFQVGFDTFLEFALKNSKNHDRIHCPCVDCCNVSKWNITMIKDHVYLRGFNRSYTNWYYHGEHLPDDPYPLGKRGVDDIEGNDFDDYPLDLLNEAQEEFLNDPEKFDNFLSDADKPLFDGCKKTKITNNVNKSKENRILIPQKVTWYMPLIPRLKRLYRSAEHSENLIWHETKRVKDGKLRHPTDSQAWKKVNYINPEFKTEPRHIRLGLSADGVNPHRSLSSLHSSWPVFLVMYNLPPWLVMKRKFNMLSLMISGPQQPGQNIDVYLEPLIDDLIKLYENGVQVYDGFKKEFFNLKAVLLWTVSDFPAYSNLSGLSTKGYEGCPICCTNTSARLLENVHKMCYMGHRRYLPANHPDRRKKKAFDGTEEGDMAPLPLSGEQILQQVELVDFKYGTTRKNIYDNTEKM
ncbi:hypothetical protein CsatB_003354 [Cannabis sativa]